MCGRIRYRPAPAKGSTMRFRQLAISGCFLICCALLITSGALAKKVPPAAPLDLNTATAPQLSQLPGIGATTAKAIVQFRQKSGPFERVNDLLAIRGISARKLERIRPYVTVSTSAPHKPSSSRESQIVSA
jgi:competence ComEA-like helix-hairpin-helix protein